MTVRSTNAEATAHSSDVEAAYELAQRIFLDAAATGAVKNQAIYLESDREDL